LTATLALSLALFIVRYSYVVAIIIAFMLCRFHDWYLQILWHAPLSYYFIKSLLVMNKIGPFIMQTVVRALGLGSRAMIISYRLQLKDLEKIDGFIFYIICVFLYGKIIAIQINP
jgi:hypothetical protein